ncbi:pleckstrin homology domain-containing family A member 5 isoform X20 [Fundulus heteroclitus]|uniref:pleckstrin homology domain-containing family A member 5 isoform X20 n=1 Tax=Fundulus heteroclitus TaxID=8078 RepID=UPI00165A41A6|nr:pleckstrin homology domain-containing family A member 5 isoform X20 [Fundulus heteroclitus]
MAAELQPEWISALPSSWTYGVTRDGRVFFINEEAKSTTWMHPVSGEAVLTGHRKTPDLPTGWEEGFTFEGARCFIKYPGAFLTRALLVPHFAESVTITPKHQTHPALWLVASKKYFKK